MMKKLIALTLSAALLLGSAAALTPEEAFPDKNAYPGYGDVQAATGSPPPHRSAMRWAS